MLNECIREKHTAENGHTGYSRANFETRLGKHEAQKL